jgi:hypothetical protein
MLSSCGSQEYIVTHPDGTKETTTRKEIRTDKKFAKEYKKHKERGNKFKAKYPDRFSETEFKADTLVKIEGREAAVEYPTIEKPEVVSSNQIKLIYLPGDSIRVECPPDSVQVEYVVRQETVEVPKFITKQLTWWQQGLMVLGFAFLVYFIILALKRR